jgi:hypothetical protein
LNPISGPSKARSDWHAVNIVDTTNFVKPNFVGTTKFENMKRRFSSVAHQTAPISAITLASQHERLLRSPLRKAGGIPPGSRCQHRSETGLTTRVAGVDQGRIRLPARRRAMDGVTARK